MVDSGRRAHSDAIAECQIYIGAVRNLHFAVWNPGRTKQGPSEKRDLEDLAGKDRRIKITAENSTHHACDLRLEAKRTADKGDTR
jgi:hypothetical protein